MLTTRCTRAARHVVLFPAISFVALLVGLFATATWAGPPLATDDPGVLIPGDWELILALDVEERGSGRYTQQPVLDASLGLTMNTQMSFVLTREESRPDGEPAVSGLGIVSLGYKWRFFSGHDWKWAMAPAYTLPASHDVIERGGADDVKVFSLPLLGARKIGSWTILGQGAWNLDSRGDRSWDYGLAAMRPFGKRVVGMLEVTSNTASFFNDHELGYRFGFDVNIADGWHVLGSLGGRLNSGPDPNDRLDRVYYLAIQWFP